MELLQYINNILISLNKECLDDFLKNENSGCINISLLGNWTKPWLLIWQNIATIIFYKKTLILHKEIYIIQLSFSLKIRFCKK